MVFIFFFFLVKSSSTKQKGVVPQKKNLGGGVLLSPFEFCPPEGDNQESGRLIFIFIFSTKKLFLVNLQSGFAFPR